MHFNFQIISLQVNPVNLQNIQIEINKKEEEEIYRDEKKVDILIIKFFKEQVKRNHNGKFE